MKHPTLLLRFFKTSMVMSQNIVSCYTHYWESFNQTLAKQFSDICVAVHDVMWFVSLFKVSETDLINDRQNTKWAHSFIPTPGVPQLCICNVSQLYRVFRGWKTYLQSEIDNNNNNNNNNILYVCFYPFIRITRPPLCSSVQSSWLQIQRFRVRFPTLPDFLSSSGSGTGSTQLYSPVHFTPREMAPDPCWIGG
jgi:hypothetical protein